MKWVSIAAVAKNGVIGNQNDLPWSIPEDLKFFRQSTKNHIVIMGRKTFLAIKKPLPHRINVVLTRDLSFQAPSNVLVFHEIADVLKWSASEPENLIRFVIGGAEIYRAFEDLVDEVWLTEIEQDYEGDTFYPSYQEGTLKKLNFKRVKQVEGQECVSQKLKYFFSVYLKI